MDYYSSHPIDLFVNVSETEGVPVSIMEAFSYSIPCFATDVGGTGEIVNRSNGHLAHKNFACRELADSIISIREISVSMGLRQNARDTFEALCSAEKNYAGLIEVFGSASA